MHEYIEWAEKLKEQLHQYKNQNDFSKDEIHCVREILHAISCAYKCQMFKEQFDSENSVRSSYGRSYRGSYGNGASYYGGYWEEPSYRGGGESYRGNGASYRGRVPYQANYSRDMAEQDLVEAMEQALPRITDRNLKDTVQQVLSEMRR